MRKISFTNGYDFPLTVRSSIIQLAPRITSLQVQRCKIAHTRDLDIIFGLDEMHALESAIRNQTGTTPRLGTPSDFLMLSITDGAVRKR